MTTVAHILAHRLQQAGVEIVFGLPGGETVELVDELRKTGIRFVLVHSESSAVFMADATARLTGKPGVCLTTLGPGAANAVAGVAHAYLDRSPVLVITAQKPDYLLPAYTHQIIDLHALFAPITKASFKLQPAGVIETIDSALSLIISGRPGPVHLQLSNEDAAHPIETSDVFENDLVRESVNNGANSTQKASAENHLDEDLLVDNIAAAHHLLSQSRRPLIVVGLGLEPERPYTALQALAEAAEAPVITTPKSKGSLPDDHPLAAGTIGLTRTDPAYSILDEADCIIAVGFDVVELVKPWLQPVPLIWIAPWPNEDPQLAAEVEYVGPLQSFLQQLTEATFSTAEHWGQHRVAAYRYELAAQILPSPTSGRMLPQTVFQAIRQNIPRDTLVTTDVGSHKILMGLSWPAYSPNRFMVSNGLSCMGFGLPAAIGASLALPGQPVISIVGDAGLAMVMGELGLLARLQTPVIVVVLNDGALDLIRSHQRRVGKLVHGTEFVNPDFIGIATAYNIEAYRVSNEVECIEAIKAAITAARPALIEVMIDPSSYPTTPG